VGVGVPAHAVGGGYSMRRSVEVHNPEGQSSSVTERTLRRLRRHAGNNAAVQHGTCPPPPPPNLCKGVSSHKKHPPCATHRSRAPGLSVLRVWPSMSSSSRLTSLRPPSTPSSTWLRLSTSTTSMGALGGSSSSSSRRRRIRGRGRIRDRWRRCRSRGARGPHATP
jgi:hypothetical protein